MRRLSTQILAMQIVIVLVTTLAGFLLSAYLVRRELDHQYELRALAVADSVATLPEVRHAVTSARPQQVIARGAIAGLAERVRRSAHVTYVVVADRTGLRYSHPNAALIGRRVSTPPTPALTGEEWVGVQTGTLGRSARGKAPIFGPGGRPVGEVSVGILERQVWAKLWDKLPTVATYMLVALALGVLASLGLTRRLKRQTFGLELDEITGLLQEREAMLHGIREGVVACDCGGEIRLVNDEARRLLDLPEGSLGRPLADAIPAGRLRDVLTGAVTGSDQLVLTGDRLLVVNRMPVRIEDRDIGSVVTVRDRTEAEELLRELDSTRSLTDALRAQTHEFTNRLHALAGLLELGRYDEASAFVTDVSSDHSDQAALLMDRLANPVLVALLLAKTATAAERGVALRLSPASVLTTDVGNPGDLVSIVGNLVDNAVDATAGLAGAWVQVQIREAEDRLTVVVADSGPGIPAERRGAVFDLGWSTKHSPAGARRGLGLALVRQVVQRCAGTVAVRDGAEGRGAIFEVTLPLSGAPSPERSQLLGSAP